jgi:hypothetical protein
MCDDEDVCSYFEISTGLVCIPDMDCYEPADALDIYFSYVNEEFDSQEIGISHGIHPSYCASDLDEEPEQDVYSVDECWSACIDTFGYEIVAVDFAYDPEGSECYCQNECDCMSEIDYDAEIMTAEWMEFIPEIC